MTYLEKLDQCNWQTISSNLDDRGYAKATMRHGVSTITRGRRRALGIIFHDAQ